MRLLVAVPSCLLSCRRRRAYSAVDNRADKTVLMPGLLRLAGLLRLGDLDSALPAMAAVAQTITREGI